MSAKRKSLPNKIPSDHESDNNFSSTKMTDGMNSNGKFPLNNNNYQSSSDESEDGSDIETARVLSRSSSEEPKYLLSKSRPAASVSELSTTDSEYESESGHSSGKGPRVQKHSKSKRSMDDVLRRLTSKAGSNDVKKVRAG